MFWTIALIASLFAAGILILTVVAMFLVNRWTKNYMKEKMTEKPIDSIPQNFNKTA